MGNLHTLPVHMCSESHLNTYTLSLSSVHDSQLTWKRKISSKIKVKMMKEQRLSFVRGRPDCTIICY